ncbi:hypothetical protein BT67DRAFT_396443 [Trichocladium antarcticum]|uniref:DUF4048 domain-containing protein n=1 Tax=Trichocladium antarcticum TaxID=1450529 RepID=A0AAN6UTP7_9PEZI|nr:hypothetical protein BT67DRAFT_396443 [Trichocladium antarcticum]
MTSVVLLRTCFVSACANALFNKRDSNPLNLRKAVVVARRSTHPTAPAYRHRPRRHPLATAANLGRRRRTPWSTYHPSFLRKTSHSFNLHKPALRRAVLKDRGIMDEMVLLQRSLNQAILSGASTAYERRHQGRGGSRDDTKPRRFPDEPLTSPPSLIDDLVETRSTRSASTASRSTNRLSLTLPIIPPTGYPLRPNPASSSTPGFPPTPLDTPSLMSPVDPTDLITAIATQERRVLELREDLAHAETELARLKRQWATHEAYKKRTARRSMDPHRGLGPAAELQDETAIQRSIELDRRRALLEQQSQQATPERSRRRVFTGSHTRNLSLLSPTKPASLFSERDSETDSPKDDGDNRHPPPVPDLHAKRASWAARSTQAPGVKQLAQDLKSGLWTFMEDLRQATVGDEPITGQGVYLRGKDGNMRSTIARSLSMLDSTGDQDTIRATSANSRPRATSAFEELPKPETPQATHSQEQETETEKGEEEDLIGGVADFRPPPLQRSKTDATRPTKRFSWTPLQIDSYDDNDWSSWDTPSSSSPRWSGTTVNGDIIPTIPEKRDENETGPLKKKTPKSHDTAFPPSTPGSPSKLEELLPPVLSLLTPSNIKRTAADFMMEWERSLSPPDMPTTASPVAGGQRTGV